MPRRTNAGVNQSAQLHEAPGSPTRHGRGSGGGSITGAIRLATTIAAEIPSPLISPYVCSSTLCQFVSYPVLISTNFSMVAPANPIPPTKPEASETIVTPLSPFRWSQRYIPATIPTQPAQLSPRGGV